MTATDSRRWRAAAVGDSFQSVEQGLRCWSELLVKASTNNAKTFDRAEWNYLADVNNGCSPLITLAGDTVRLAVTLLWANAENGHRLDGTGAKWFDEDDADKRVKALVKKLRDLDFVHGWAVMVAIQWFWEHCQEINHGEDVWWAVEFRKAQVGRSSEEDR